MVSSEKQSHFKAGGRIRRLGSVFGAATFPNPFIDCRFVKSQISTELEVRNSPIFYESVHGRQVAVQVVSKHPRRQDFITGVAVPLFTGSYIFHNNQIIIGHLQGHGFNRQRGSLLHPVEDRQPAIWIQGRVAYAPRVERPCHSLSIHSSRRRGLASCAGMRHAARL